MSDWSSSSPGLPPPGKYARLLALHDRSQSSASMRAALAPLLARLPSGYHVHFLDAPFCTLLPTTTTTTTTTAAHLDRTHDDGAHVPPTPVFPPASDASLPLHHDDAGLDAWQRAAHLASLLDAVLTDVSQLRSNPRSTTATSLPSLQASESLEAALRDRIAHTPHADEVWREWGKSGVDGVESLVGRKSGRSLDRDWTVAVQGAAVVGADGATHMAGSAARFGLAKTLAYVGDYMREHGPFHGVVGCGSGATIATLLQSLLYRPRTALPHFPSFFAELPAQVRRAPRMGGWDGSDDVGAAVASSPYDAARGSRGEALPPGRFAEVPPTLAVVLLVHAERGPERRSGQRGGGEAGSSIDGGGGRFGGLGGTVLPEAAEAWWERHAVSPAHMAADEECWLARVSTMTQKGRPPAAGYEMHFGAEPGEILPQSAAQLDRLAEWVRGAAAASQGDEEARARLIQQQQQQQQQSDDEVRGDEADADRGQRASRKPSRL